MGNICFMMKRKSFSDLLSSEVFGDVLFDKKTEHFDFFIFHLKYNKAVSLVTN